MSRTLDWTALGDKASFPVFFRFRVTQTDNQCKCFIIVRVCHRQNGLQITYYIVGYIKEYPSTNMHMNIDMTRSSKDATLFLKQILL